MKFYGIECEGKFWVHRVSDILNETHSGQSTEARIAYDRATEKLYVATDTEWIKVTNPDDLFSTATKILFGSYPLPDGWNIDTQYNDISPMITNETGSIANSGGSWEISGTTATGSHNHDGRTSIANYAFQWSGYSESVYDAVTRNHWHVIYSSGNHSHDFSVNWRPKNVKMVVASYSPYVGLLITISVDRSVLRHGENVVFTTEVENQAGYEDATGVAASLALDSSLFTYVSDDSGGNWNSSTGVWTIGNLASGSTETLNVTASVTRSGYYTNATYSQLAEITDFTETDETYGNNDDTITITPSAGWEDYTSTTYWTSGSDATWDGDSWDFKGQSWCELSSSGATWDSDFRPFKLRVTASIPWTTERDVATYVNYLTKSSDSDPVENLTVDTRSIAASGQLTTSTTPRVYEDSVLTGDHTYWVDFTPQLGHSTNVNVLVFGSSVDHDYNLNGWLIYDTKGFYVSWIGDERFALRTFNGSATTTSYLGNVGDFPIGSTHYISIEVYSTGGGGYGWIRVNSHPTSARTSTSQSQTLNFTNNGYSAGDHTRIWYLNSSWGGGATYTINSLTENFAEISSEGTPPYVYLLDSDLNTMVTSAMNWGGDNGYTADYVTQVNIGQNDLTSDIYALRAGVSTGTDIDLKKIEFYY